MNWDSKKLLEAARLYSYIKDLKLGTVNLDINGYAICEFNSPHCPAITLAITPKENSDYYKVAFEFVRS